MSFDDCTYVDPKSGAPCLKVRGHDDLKGGWKCSYCGPAEGLAEHFVCKCGRGAQAPSQHLTMTGWDGKAITKIVSLEEFSKEYQHDTNMNTKPLHSLPRKEDIGLDDLPEMELYSSSYLDGVIIRSTCKDSCATKKAPPGRLLVGEFACDCKVPLCSECAKISGQKPRPGVHAHPTRPDEMVCGWCRRRIERRMKGEG